MKKKLLSLVLAAVLMLSVLAVPAAAAEAPEFADTKGHWAEDVIDQWSQYGVVQGYNGKFNPNASMTRGEFAQAMVNLLGLTKKPNYNPFTDLEGDEWYADSILKLFSAGIMKGDESKRCNAKSRISREEAFVMVARALGVKVEAEEAQARGAEDNTKASAADIKAAKPLENYEDADKVSSWAKPYMKALVEGSYINGVTDTTLQPNANINRASVMKVLANTVTVYAVEPGEYTAPKKGFAIIKAPGAEIILKGELEGVILSQSSEKSTLTLDKAIITGDLKVEASESTVNVNESAVRGAVEITPQATGTSLIVPAGSTVEAVITKGSDVKIDGEGEVKKVEVAAGDKVEINTPGTTVEVNEELENVQVSAGGNEVKPGETSSTDGEPDGFVEPEPEPDPAPAPAPDTSVAKIGSTGYATLEEAITAANTAATQQSPVTIVLRKDAAITTTEDRGIIIGSYVTLDLSGRTVSRREGNNKFVLQVQQGSKNVSVKNGTIATEGGGVFVKYGSTGAVLENINISIPSGARVEGIVNWGELEIKSGTYTCAGDFCAVINQGDGEDKGVLTLSGGKYEHTGEKGAVVNFGGDVNIRGNAEIKGKGKNGAVVENRPHEVDNTVGIMAISEQATITATEGNALALFGAGTTNISGGTVSAKEVGIVVGNASANDGWTAGAKLTISGGQINGGTSGIYMPRVGNGGFVTIDGGTVAGTLSGVTVRSGILNLTSGTVTSTTPRVTTADAASVSGGEDKLAGVIVLGQPTDSYTDDITINLNSRITLTNSSANDNDIIVVDTGAQQGDWTITGDIENAKVVAHTAIGNNYTENVADRTWTVIL